MAQGGRAVAARAHEADDAGDRGDQEDLPEHGLDHRGAAGGRR